MCQNLVRNLNRIISTKQLDISSYLLKYEIDKPVKQHSVSNVMQLTKFNVDVGGRAVMFKLHGQARLYRFP